MLRLGRATVGVLAVAATLVLSGCADTSAGGPPPPPDPEAGDAVVKLVGLDFEPQTLRITVGQRVRWQWTDSVVHNIVSSEFASSPERGGGGAHAVRFDRAGTFPYRCTLHAGMDGTIIVTT